MQPLLLEITARTGKPFIPFLRRHLLAAHAILRPPLQELSVALVGDARMSQLHEAFMDIPGPTDVLTFPLDENAKGLAISGEVIVCVPEAARRMKEHGHKLEHELLLYCLHGLLHLSGYDDRTARDFRRMHTTEDMILTKLGIGAVFSPTRDADALSAASFAQKRAKRPASPKRVARGAH